MKELMYDINAGLVAAVLLVIVLAAIEVGFRLGRRSQGAALDDDSKAHINATQASTLGILALLLAFTFSLSLGDYIAVDLVGGKTQVIGSVVYDNFSADLPFASAFAVIPVIVMVAYILGIRRTGALENL